jgi:hypothetical protein
MQSSAADTASSGGGPGHGSVLQTEGSPESARSRDIIFKPGGIFTAEAQNSSGFSFGPDSIDADTEMIKSMRACSLFAQVVEEPQQASVGTEPSVATQGVRLQSPSHFYHVLGVPQDADERSILRAIATVLVELPYVLAYLDRFVTADATQWADLWRSLGRHKHSVAEKARFEACMRAYASVQTGAAAKLLKTELLIIPACRDEINLYPGEMYCGACAGNVVPPQDFELERWEQIHAARVVLLWKKTLRMHTTRSFARAQTQPANDD